MSKMVCPTKIKYNGKTYKANEPFNVKLEDVAALKQKGAWLLEPMIAPVEDDAIVEISEIKNIQPNRRTRR